MKSFKLTHPKFYMKSFKNTLKSLHELFQTHWQFYNHQHKIHVAAWEEQEAQYWNTQINKLGSKTRQILEMYSRDNGVQFIDKSTSWGKNQAHQAHADSWDLSTWFLTILFAAMQRYELIGYTMANHSIDRLSHHSGRA
jgi:hypothetical protein